MSTIDRLSSIPFSARAGSAAAARPGFGMLAVLLVMLLVGAIAGAAATLGLNTVLVNTYTLRESNLKAAADDGLEIARARINGDTTVYNDTAFVALETNASVRDAAGNVIPGLTRTTWVGPGGIATGQYGRFGEIVDVVRDPQGNQVIRREAVMQESFAKYAYFTNSEGNGILFGGGDQIQGPVFSNDILEIHSTGATFLGPVSTAQTISGRIYGTFRQTVTENATAIRFPQIGNVTRLQGYAAAGGTAFTASPTPPRFDQATMRIEFVWADVNGDGKPQPEEGYIRVYTVDGNGSSAAYLSADVPTGAGNDLRNSQNCGHYDGTTFVTAYAHPNNAANGDNNVNAVRQPGVRCFLGGDEGITNGFVPSTNGSTTTNSNAVGSWLVNPTPDPAVAGRPDGAYLFPVSHQRNANFKGVIYVTGKVGISGTVVGHLTLAATDNIIILDDIRYAVNRGAGGCQDLLGLYSARSIVVADNVMNSPARSPATGSWTSYGATTDEFIDAVVMALDSFTVANLDAASQSRTTEPCNGSVWGRGCLFLTGGVIQGTRGRVAVTSGTGGTGYLKRYSYDKCAAEIPPPYFPTTGWFERAQYYEVNPKGFDMATYTGALKARP